MAFLHLIVVDKPHFLPAVPSGGYLLIRPDDVLSSVRAEPVEALRRAQGERFILYRAESIVDTVLVPIHRIDRDTAGLVMFSKQLAIRAIYCALFSQHPVRKTYEAIAPWRGGLSANAPCTSPDTARRVLNSSTTHVSELVADLEVDDVLREFNGVERCHVGCHAVGKGMNPGNRTADLVSELAR